MTLERSLSILGRGLPLSVVAVCTLIGSIAGASDPSASQAIVETRQQGFKKMGAALKTINDQLKTDAPDTGKISAAAQVISASAPQVIGWFPAGSGPESGVDTDALDFIWKDPAKFESSASKLVAESKTLVTTVAGSDLAAIKAQAKAVSESCGGCHRSFRAD